ncbi:restriction endonuclease subunit S [Aeromonas sp. QDB11]|uniref:restriction endonuclease subunit S n=1 Tax=Aeromonas sp. QDB11 TaxID=2990482 RepID=UPI0022E7E7F9|nr:restriction endonuclease subunit S [Aeromonas sp. QDB11]
MAEQMMQEAAGKAIPAGYQQTEVGAILEDWEAIPLGGICKVQGGFAFKSEKFKKTGVPILRISNIQSGFLDVNEVVYYAVGEKIPKQFEVHDGDALIAMSGATTGKVGVYNKNEVAYLNQRVGKFVLYGNADMKYIQHVVGSDLYKSALSNMLEQGAQPNISSSQLERIIIRKPTLEIEQKIIANVLSDSDALIDALEQLIAKKQAIKSGTMQQLLTGRTRLPAFALRPDGTKKGYKPSELGDIPEDWEVIPLGDICRARS